MTRNELASLLHKLMWALDDAGHKGEAWDYEEAYERVLSKMSDEDLARFSEHFLPKGKRGRVRLVLDNPYRARATAFLVCLLRNFRTF